MADEKRISVSFGAFAVDIEGYDDPFAVLSAVISHIKSESGAPLGEKGFAANDLENAALLASLSSEAADLELTGDGENPRLLVKPKSVEEDMVAAPAHVEAPDVDAPRPVANEPPALVETARVATPTDEPEQQTDGPSPSDAELDTEPAPEPEAPIAETTPEAEAPVVAADEGVSEPVEDEKPGEAAEELAGTEAEAEPVLEVEKPVEETPVANSPDEAPEDTEAPSDVDAVAEVEETAGPLAVAAKDEPTPAVEPAAVSDDEGDEEAAILRRVRRAITRVEDETTDAPIPRPKPIAARSPAEQKADVVKDIATTLRRIGAQPEQPAAEIETSEVDVEAAPVAAAPPPPADATPEKPKISPLSTTIANPADAKPKIRDGATGQLKPKARKPLTMQMQIRPKKPADSDKPARVPLRRAVDAPETAPIPKVSAPDLDLSQPQSAESATAPHEVLDRHKIRERLVDLAKEDEVIDNFLFEDVDVVEVTDQGPPEPAETHAAAPADPGDAPVADEAKLEFEGVDEGEEPLVLTASEAAPLVLDNPVEEPLVLTDPIEPPQAVPAAAMKPPVIDDEAPEEGEEPEILELQDEVLELTPDPQPEPEIAPEAEPEPASAPAKAKKADPDEPAGFSRLSEVRDTPIPVMVEPSTRPKRRNGDPRLVALSDETQFDKSMSPQDFAAHIGASSLHDMLEATAVYMAIVEGRANFSRLDIMQAFSRIDASGQYSSEQRLKTFRKLLSSGALTRVDERDFTLSHETRFGYEAQLRA